MQKKQSIDSDGPVNLFKPSSQFQKAGIIRRLAPLEMLEHNRMWKIVTFMALAVIPGSAEDSDENRQVIRYTQLNAGIQQILTIEESVALASRKIEISSWHLYLAMHPVAILRIMAILHDREKMSCQRAAIQ